jgi:hypothetical protein
LNRNRSDQHEAHDNIVVQAHLSKEWHIAHVSFLCVKARLQPESDRTFVGRSAAEPAAFRQAIVVSISSIRNIAILR